MTFQECTKLAPKDARNWQSLAISKCPSFIAPLSKEKNKTDEAVLAFKKALKLKPDEPHILQELTLFTRASHPQEGIEILEKLAPNDNNSYLWLVLADLRIRSSRKMIEEKENLQVAQVLQTKAVDALQQACRVNRLYAPIYVFPTPDILSKVWEEKPIHGEGTASQIGSNLTRTLLWLAGYYKEQGERTKLYQIAQTLLDVSHLYMAYYRGDTEDVKNLDTFHSVAFSASLCYIFFFNARSYAQKCQDISLNVETQMLLERIDKMRPGLERWTSKAW